MTRPTSEEASAALGELAAGRRAVAAAERRGLPVLLAAWSLLVLVDYAAKDHIPDRRVRRMMTGACQVATVALGMVDHAVKPVQPVSVDPADVGPRAAAPIAAALIGWTVTERLVITGLRRSGLRWPNTVAGVVLAIGRPAGYVGLLRLVPRPKSGV